jgi:cellulose synthase/poly-beta-1,6-N-acetylglucosamine synthase-like glycosyltransferase
MRDDSASEGEARGAVKEPLVSIIIPAYRVAPFMIETLASVLAQTYTNHEAIVINDGPQDTYELEPRLRSGLRRRDEFWRVHT